jgi:hypothetical protein
MLRSLWFSIFAATALGEALNISQAQAIWQPAVGSKWQIMLRNSLSVDPANQGASQSMLDTPIWDVDLFNTPQGVIQYLKSQGKKVICYFSAGTAEDWRSDYTLFNPRDFGNNVKCWPGERWLNIRSQDVWGVMQKRIQYAAQKGCDAIDPDNIGKLL